MIDVLAALYERHGQPTVIGESNAMGGPVCEQLQRDGLKVRPFVTSNVSKAEGIEALALGFEQGRIKIPNDPILIGELQAFEATQLPSGRMQYAAPAGLHDDLVMALMLAYSAVSGVSHMTSRGVFELYEQEAKALAAGKVAPIDRGQSAAMRWFGNDGQPAENPQQLLSKDLGRILRRW
jgi:hypothetical protein